jgi:hypothetical protein
MPLFTRCRCRVLISSRSWTIRSLVRQFMNRVFAGGSAGTTAGWVARSGKPFTINPSTTPLVASRCEMQKSEFRAAFCLHFAQAFPERSDRT